MMGVWKVPTQAQMDFAPPARPSIEERFEAFHAANPHVYWRIVRLARQHKAFGHPKGSMKALFEVMRWNMKVKTSGKPWKLNNIYTAHYAQLVMEECPDLRGFFETRERKTSNA